MAAPRIDRASIPAELAAPPRWVCWRSEERDGKPTKVPYRPRGGARASATDPSHWSDLDTALAAAEDARRGYDGVGFVFAPNGGFAGVDLDDSLDEDGRPLPWARAIIEKLASYTEVSPSGRGVKIFVRGELPQRDESGARARRRAGDIEMYDRERYFTVTGNHLAGTPLVVEQRGEQLAGLHAEVFDRGERGKRPAPRAPGPAEPDDARLIELASRSKSGSKFRSLWAGHASGYPSLSEADLALASMMSFYTGPDPDRLERLMRQSGLARSKYERDDYLRRTVEKALAGRTEFYGGPRAATARADSGGLPEVMVTGRHLRDQTADALAALEAANTPPVLFRRGVGLARIVRDQHGRGTVEPVGPDQLTGMLARAANFVRADRDGVKPCNPPGAVVRDILALGAWRFPFLAAVVEAPRLRPDGTVLTEPGYDPATGMYLIPARGMEVITVPHLPTPEDVSGAVSVLNQLIVDFPFVDEASRTNFIAYQLTPVLRHAFDGCAPMAAFEAKSKQGTGKTLLARCGMIAATGHDPSTSAVPSSEEEFRKSITADLAAGKEVILYDNLREPLESGALANAITSRFYEDRILGVSRKDRLPVMCTWAVTGNAIVVGGDMGRRLYWIVLDANCEYPEDRDGFRHELPSWALHQRAELLRALLVLCRAWWAAGCPAPRVQAWGSFEAWTRTVGGVLQHAGYRGFLGNRARQRETANLERQEWGGFLTVISLVFPDGTAFTTAALALAIADLAKVREALPAEVGQYVGKDNFSVRLGLALRQQAGRICGGLRLEEAGRDSHAKVAQWRVVSLAAAGGAEACGGFDGQPEGPAANCVDAETPSSSEYRAAAGEAVPPASPRTPRIKPPLGVPS